MPNAARDLKKRLLHLFPLKTIKDYFNVKGNFEDVIEELSVKTMDTLIQFSLDNSNITRQNISLFTLDSNFTRNEIDDTFPFKIEKESHGHGEYTFLCLPKTTFSVYLSNPVEKEDLIFYQPVIIRLSGKSMIIHFTKLEKSVASYYEYNREAKKATVINTQESILALILNYLSESYTIEPADFNKGIKKLWHVDDIDCFKIQSQNPFSVKVETMNGDLTFKEKYPEEYERIILTPLNSAQWKYLKDDEYLCEGFTADPSAGQISITKSPKNVNQVTNVISKILAGN